MKQELQCFLYHSELDCAAKVNCVADIVKEARSFNELHEITGVLMFDGHRFAQYIEGSPEKIELLVSKLAKDPRHTNFTEQYIALRSGKRLFPNWFMAYVHFEDTDPLAVITSLKGELALKKLEEMLPELDYA